MFLILAAFHLMRSTWLPTSLHAKTSVGKLDSGNYGPKAYNGSSLA